MEIRIEFEGYSPFLIEVSDDDSLRDVKRRIKEHCGLSCSAGDLVLRAACGSQGAERARLIANECLQYLSCGSTVHVVLGSSRTFCYSDVTATTSEALPPNTLNSLFSIGTTDPPSGRYLLKESRNKVQNPPDEGATYFTRMKKVTRESGVYHDNLVTERGLWYKRHGRETSTCPLRGKDQASFQVVLLMDLVDGLSLEDALYPQSCCREGRFLSMSGIQEVARQVLCGLHHLHQHNVSHGLIHLSHLMLERRTSTIKLLPGYSFTRLCTNCSDCHIACHTLVYLAPEVMKGECLCKKAKTRGDIWSFGLCLAELALGRFPFRECTPLEVFYRIANCTACPVDWKRLEGEQSVEICPLFKSFLSRCLQTDPAKRASAEELMDHPFLKHTYEGYAKNELATWLAEAEEE